MICEKVSFCSPWILRVYALRQQELRLPLGLNLFNENLLLERDEKFFIGYANDNLFSCLQLKKISHHALKLRQMATDNSSQGAGYGKQLVQFAEEWARRHSYTRIELHARQVAQGFYNKLGYEKEGEEFLEVDIPHYYMVKRL